jgi:glutamyl-tRNA reductase
MAELAARALAETGVKGLSILNRTRARAERLAARFDARPLAWQELELALPWADIVIASTGAPHAIFRRQNVSQALSQRRRRPLFFIDIAVPRNVESEVEELEGVYRYDIDDLERVVENSLAERRREAPKVESIVAEVQQEFMAWYRSLDVVPTIVDLRRQAHAMRQAEVERALRRLPELTDHDREIVQGMAKRIVNKLLHYPTICLKQQASCADGHRYAEVVRDLFGLDGKGEQR